MRWKFPAGIRTDEPDAFPVHGAFRVYRVAGICISQPAKIEIADSVSGVGFRGVLIGGDFDWMDYVSGIALTAVSLFDGVVARC
jgi:hypothetical protein